MVIQPAIGPPPAAIRASCGWRTASCSCVFHTDFVDGDREIRAVRLREEE